jgi:hypothetical protein
LPIEWNTAHCRTVRTDLRPGEGLIGLICGR